jgi:hypothetical protein
MSDRPSNEEREAMIAGDRAGALEPDEAAELPLLAGLLGDPATWAEPDPGLEDAVVLAVADAEPPAAIPAPAPVRRRHRVRLSALVAAAAAIVVLVVGGVLLATGGGGGADYQGRLTAVGPAPGASATVGIDHTSAGFRVALDAHGLPPLQPGEYYQAWLKDGAGTLVPIGSFSSSDGKVTLWSGVSPRAFPTLTVTIEQADGVQASSGRRVLIGEIHPH